MTLINADKQWTSVTSAKSARRKAIQRFLKGFIDRENELNYIGFDFLRNMIVIVKIAGHYSTNTCNYFGEEFVYKTEILSLCQYWSRDCLNPDKFQTSTYHYFVMFLFESKIVSKTVIPAKAGIQILLFYIEKSGFRVKPGMTDSLKKYIENTT